MKTYFTFIKYFQESLMALSILILATLPAALVLMPEWFSDSRTFLVYAIAHVALFLVMAIRPLADIFRGVKWIRPLVILRKGMGVFSAALVISFTLAKIITDASGYFISMTSTQYWSFENLAVLAHLADISAILLLVTSNNLSKKLLGANWKRIQRLSYVYFYASATYVYVMLHESMMLTYMVLVTVLTVLAWLRNHGYILQTRELSPASV